MRNYISNFEFRISNFRCKRSGFTLVELLVVIGVIAIIMAAVFPNFMGIRERARDARRKTDLSEIQKALELFKMDQNPQSFPTTGAFPAGICGTCWSSSTNCTGNIYMNSVPCDPLAPTPYSYTLDATDNLRYTLSACLENMVDPDKDSIPVTVCTLSTGVSYSVSEP